MAKKTASKHSLQDALKLLEKKHGAGTVMRLAKGQHITKTETLSTGVYSIDRALGGGFARGRVVELYGSEGSGKTTLALQTIVKAQQDGLKAAYIDVEHAFDMTYAKSLGINLEELYFSQPDSAEQVFDIAKTLAQTGEFAVIVIDSVAALTPATEFEAEVGKSQIGHLARFISTALKQTISEFANNNTTLILINQLRMMIGVVYGNPETTPGGKALKHYASQRVAIRRSTKIEDTEGNIIGFKGMIKVEKNKIALPFLKAEVPFLHGKGFDAVSDIFMTCIRMDIISKEKISYFFDKEKIGVGEKNAVDAVRANPELQAKLKKAIETALEKDAEIENESTT